MKNKLLLGSVFFISFYSLIPDSEAAAPTVVNPIGNRSWSGSGSKSFQVPANTFSDADGDALTYSATRGDGSALPSWLRFSASTRTFRGNPPAGIASRALKVIANDGHGGTASSTFTLSFSNVNDTPTVQSAMADQLWSGSGAKSFVIPATTFADADGDTLTYSAVLSGGAALPSWLTFSPATRTFSGNPSSAPAARSIVVRVDDGHGGTVSDTFNLTFGGSTNDTPRVVNPIADQSWSGSGIKSFQVPANTFADSDRDTLTYTARLSDGSALPAWLRFSGTTRTFSGNPPAGVTALDLRVTANDGHGSTIRDTFRVTFASANDTPVAVSDTLAVTGTTPATDTLTATDGDGDPLTYRLIANGAKGRATLTNATTGAYSYTANAGATGTDSFTFRVNDGRVDSNTATVTVTIQNANTAPVASAGVLTTTQNATGAGTLIATDAEHDSLTFSIVTNGTKGVASLLNAATGSYRYIPNAGASGTDHFTFKANDGRADSNTATVTITIGGVPAPVARTGQSVSYGANDDGATRKGIVWPDPRFTDGGNGTITDHLTGLVWMKNANCWGSLTWNSALDKVAGLNAGTQSCAGYTTGTHTDWRLANIKEMKSLIDRSRTAPGLPAGHPFTNVQSDYYWTSTTNASSTSSAWVVYLGSGFISSSTKTPTCYSWMVRGGL
ncbi:MAG: tandem-95 repeat protein [Magnetococcales bacterium]|nr:tandem-95 repeat protein [Magnetococcales bacterium]